MKTLITFLCFQIIFMTFVFAQNGIEKYKGKTFIFDSYEQIKTCTNIGGNVNLSTTTAIKGSLFTVEHVMDNGDLVIVFNKWNLPKKTNSNYAIALDNRSKYNFKSEPTKGIKSNATESDNILFFLLEKKVMEASCSEYTISKSWEITFGTITTPFKFRSSPFLFVTNLSLGTSVCFQKKIFSNFSWGIIGGLSLSSVTLDSFSTKGLVKTNTDRPAVTPSIHAMIGYKNINLTLGIGWDFINRTSNIEESWNYQGNRWIGIGIGVSLFNANTNTTSTSKTQDQTK